MKAVVWIQAWAAAGALALSGAHAVAQTFRPLTLDPSTSRVNVVFNLLSASSSAGTALDASAEVALPASGNGPVLVRNVRVRVPGQIGFLLIMGVNQPVNARTNGLDVRWADSGFQAGFGSLQPGQAVALSGAPTASYLSGTAAYDSAGLACQSLQQQGRPCVFSGALTGPVSTTLTGTATGTASGADIAITLTALTPINPASPSLGSVSVQAVLFGSVTSAPACAADFDQSGTLEVADIFVFLSSWFAMNPRADIDGNNAIDVADIFAFLSAFFRGC